MQNIYDFDDTIYKGDSTKDFYFYCLKRYPKMLLTVPKTLWAFLMYLLGVYTKTQFKETMYRFLCHVQNHEDAVKDFWEIKKDNFYGYYMEAKRENDIVISASPEFLVKPACEMLGVKNVMASDVDLKTGKYTGENCWGKEKVRRLREKFGDIHCHNFYSDSLSDTPLAKLADNAYIVKKGVLIDWEQVENDKKIKIKKMFFSREFLMFLIIGGINTLNGIWMSYAYSAVIPNANIAFVVGYVSSMVISYILNSKLTFREKLSFVKYVKFFISYMPNFIIQNIAVFIFYNILHWNKLLVYALAAIVGVPVTFLFMKVFAFGKKKKK